MSGTNTGVFVGNNYNDTSHAQISVGQTPDYQFFSEVVSKVFNFNGPAMVCDTACGSGLTAMTEAVTAMRNNRCDNAIVAGINIGLRPWVQMQFQKLNMLSADGKCKALDESADGYAKGEACVVIFLQKRSNAKRIYSEVVNIVQNSDGYKENGITFPKWETQRDVMKACYSSAGVDTDSVEYIEAHLTGTQAGDTEEMRAVTDVLWSDKRTTPIMIGAHKSNIGHTEAASGLCALSKVIMAFENELIPRNLHLNNPNKMISSLINGQIKPINENTPFKGDIAGINNFGFGGSNTHLIVKCPKIKHDDNDKIVDGLPRLVNVCARSEESVEKTFEKLFDKPVNRDLLSLINDLSKSSPFKSNDVGYEAMTYRGFALIDENDRNLKDIKQFNVRQVKEKRDLWFVISGLGSEWTSIATELNKIEFCRRTMDELSKCMDKLHGIDLMKIMNKPSNSLVESTLTSTAIQISLIDLLDSLEITAKGIVCHSLGDLVSAYADRCLTKEETISMAYVRAKYIKDNVEEKGIMYEIGMNSSEMLNICPPDVSIANEISDQSVIISGKEEAVNQFVESLKAKNIRCDRVESNGFAFQSPLMYTIDQKLFNSLNSIMKSQREREKLSTKCMTLSAQTLVNNVIFGDNVKNRLESIPSNAIQLHFNPSYVPNNQLSHNLLNSENVLQSLFTCLGRLYTYGMNPCIERLYPSVSYPVANGTRFVSPLISWDHSVQHTVHKYPEYYSIGQKRFWGFAIDLKHKNDAFIFDHKINGRCLVPMSAYIVAVWKRFAEMKDKNHYEMPISITDYKVHRAMFLEEYSQISFAIQIDQSTGFFEILHNESLIASGHIAQFDNGEFTSQHLLDENRFEKSKVNESMGHHDIYKELRLRGYDYGNAFRLIRKGYREEVMFKTRIEWTENWVTFIDAMLQVCLKIGTNAKGLYLPVMINKVMINPAMFNTVFQDNIEDNIDVIYDENTQCSFSHGIEVIGQRASLVKNDPYQTKPLLSSYRFVPIVNRQFDHDNKDELEQIQSILAMIEKSAINGSPIEKDELIQAFDMIKEMPTNNKLIELFTDQSKQDTKIDNLIQLLETFNIRFLTEEFFRPLLNVAFQNQFSTSFLVTEVSANTYLLKTTIDSVFKYVHGHNITCNIVHLKPDKLDQDQRLRVNLVPWCPRDNSPLVLTRPAQIMIVNYVFATNNNSNNLSFEELFDRIKDQLIDNGFIMVVFKENNFPVEDLLRDQFGVTVNTIAKQSVIDTALSHDMTLIGHYCDKFSFNVLLFRKIVVNIPDERHYLIEVSDQFDDWLPTLRTQLQTSELSLTEKRIWLTSTSDQFSGIIGLYNCLLREKYENIRMIFNKTPELEISQEMMREIIKKDLKFNLIVDGKLGFYQNKPMLLTAESVPTKHCALNTAIRGDLSSFQWFECQHKYWPIGPTNDKQLFYIYYSALNFKDVMLATGRLSTDAIPEKIALKENILGFEFSGKDENGNRVMGITSSQALATTCLIKPDFLWPVPNHWTLEDAATVPVVYMTAYYALIVRGNLKRGERVLIHSGSGGVGQAAINICMDLECHLFISVGNIDKKLFLQKLYPSLTDRQFCSSRDLSFKSHIMSETNGSGVDVVLNSLSEDKLKASLECLAINGRFVEIGKYDMSVDNKIDITALNENNSLISIQLDTLNDYNDRDLRLKKDIKRLKTLMTEGISEGVVRPLNRTVFAIDKCEDAFRYMASGKHIGKVLLRIRDEEIEQQISSCPRFLAIPRTVFHPNKCYVITGGLGGMGLEIIDWMIKREAKHFVITSRNGPKNGYQKMKLKSFTKIGANIIISNENTTTLSSADNLLRMAQTIAPIGGIFHLQTILNVGLFVDQTSDAFRDVCDTKSEAFKHLDLVSRHLCPQIDYFIGFSSLASFQGIAGSSNYGYSNAVLETVIEQRRADGLTGQAIQWGYIGDVGMAVDYFNDTDSDTILELLPQKIPSVLKTLDRFLQSNEIICTSFISARQTKLDHDGEQVDLMTKVAHIIGIDDYTKVNQNKTLVSFGMDSLMNVEIKQIIEEDYNLFVTTKEIRQLTFSKLRDINAGEIKALKFEKKFDFHEFYSNDDKFAIPTHLFFPLNDQKTGRPVFYIPPLFNWYGLDLFNKLTVPALAINYTEYCFRFKSIEELSEYYLSEIATNFPEFNMEFDLMGYSFGGGIAFEMSTQLEQKGHKPSLILIDTVPKYYDNQSFKIEMLDKYSPDELELFVMIALMMDNFEFKFALMTAYLKPLSSAERIAKMAELIKERSGQSVPIDNILFALNARTNKLKIGKKYFLETVHGKASEADILLIRSTELSVKKFESEVYNDYEISKLFKGKVTRCQFPGDHQNFIYQNQDDIVKKINEFLNE